MATPNLETKYINTETRLEFTSIDSVAESKSSSRNSFVLDRDDANSSDDIMMDRCEFFLYRSSFSDEVAGMTALGFGEHHGMNIETTATINIVDRILGSEETTPIVSDELNVLKTLYELLNQSDDSDEEDSEADELERVEVDIIESCDESDDEEHVAEQLVAEVVADAIAGAIVERVVVDHVVVKSDANTESEAAVEEIINEVVASLAACMVTSSMAVTQLRSSTAEDETYEGREAPAAAVQEETSSETVEAEEATEAAVGVDSTGAVNELAEHEEVTKETEEEPSADEDEMLNEIIAATVEELLRIASLEIEEKLATKICVEEPVTEEKKATETSDVTAEEQVEEIEAISDSNSVTKETVEEIPAAESEEDADESTTKDDAASEEPAVDTDRDADAPILAPQAVREESAAVEESADVDAETAMQETVTEEIATAEELEVEIATDEPAAEPAVERESVEDCEDVTVSVETVDPETTEDEAAATEAAIEVEDIAVELELKVEAIPEPVFKAPRWAGGLSTSVKVEDVAEAADDAEAETDACIHVQVEAADEAPVVADSDTITEECSAAIPEDPPLKEDHSLQSDMETATVEIERQKDANQSVSVDTKASTRQEKTEDTDGSSDTDSSEEIKPEVAGAEQSTDDDVAETVEVETEDEEVMETEEPVAVPVDAVEAAAGLETVATKDEAADAVEQEADEEEGELELVVGAEAVTGDEPAQAEAVEVEEAEQTETIETTKAVEDATEGEGVAESAKDNALKSNCVKDDAVVAEIEVTVEEPAVADSVETDAANEADVANVDASVEDPVVIIAKEVVVDSEPVSDTVEESTEAVKEVVTDTDATEHVSEETVGEVATEPEPVAVESVVELASKLEVDAAKKVIEAPATEVEKVDQTQVVEDPFTNTEAVAGAEVDATIEESTAPEIVEADVKVEPSSDAIEEETVESCVVHEETTMAELVAEVPAVAIKNAEETVTEEASAATPVEVVEAVEEEKKLVEAMPVSETVPVEEKPFEIKAASSSASENKHNSISEQKFEVDTKPINAVAMLIGRFEKFAKRNAEEAANSRTSSRVSSRVSSPLSSPPTSYPLGNVFETTANNIEAIENDEKPAEELTPVDPIKEEAETKVMAEDEARRNENVEETPAIVEEKVYSVVKETDEAVEEEIPDDEETIEETAVVEVSGLEDEIVPEVEVQAAAAVEKAPVVDVAETTEEVAAVEEIPAEMEEILAEPEAVAIEQDTEVEEMATYTAEDIEPAFQAPETVEEPLVTDENVAEEVVECSVETAREAQTITTVYGVAETSILSIETPENKTVRDIEADTRVVEVEPVKDALDELAVTTADFTSDETIGTSILVKEDPLSTETPEIDSNIELESSHLASPTKETRVVYEDPRESQAASDNQKYEPSIFPQAPTIQTEDPAVTNEATAKAPVEMTPTTQATKADVDEAVESTSERDSTQDLPFEHVTYEILGVTRAHNVVMYHIYTVDSASGERSVSIAKRYSEFKLLDEQLRALDVSAAHDLPELPKPSVGTFLRGRRSKKTIEMREKAFGDLLHYVTQHKELHESAVFQQFIAN